MSKIIDCITFFSENYIFDLRYNILENFVDYFVICESKYDHRGKPKTQNFKIKDNFKKEKIKLITLEQPFPKENNPWQNQAIQRDFMLKNLDFLEKDDYIFFSDPDEIPNPNLLKNFKLKKKYGIFMQKCFNYKFNLFNKYESPWEGTRVCKKKNLKSIDYMRMKVKTKNLNYPFWRVDKEKSIEIFEDSGWHFHNIMSAEEISTKLKSFAHTEYSDEKFSSPDIINKKINEKVDLYNRGHKYEKKELIEGFPEYLIKNKEKYKKFLI
tara:strand:- start:61 stop:864 length:804 start_codon:yes stop_codon:yes gene_type:complete